MMIVKLVVVLALVAAPAYCSAGVKGYSQQREETKGGRLLAPVEQQRVNLEAAKGAAEQHPIAQQQLVAEHREEQRELREQQREQIPLAEQKPEEFHQQREEIIKQEELPAAPTKGLTQAQPLRYEARPQIREEQRELNTKTSRFEHRDQQFTQQKEEKFEQKQTLEHADSFQQREQQQVVEIRQEQQRRLEEAPLVQSALPLAAVEDSREFQQQRVEYAATKGGQQSPISAPLGEAEPYAFNYQVEGSSRSESGDNNGVVRGQYTVQGADGSNRIVEYIADHNGFRASVNTNELGTESKSPAGVALRTSQPLAEDLTLRLEGKTRESLLPPAAPLAVKAPAVPPKPDNWNVKGAPLAVQTPQQPLPLAPIAQAPLQLEETKTFKREESIKGAAPLAATKSEPAAPLLEAQRVEYVQEQAPVKSAEIRAPKAFSGELKQAAAPEVRSAVIGGFESATAHRAYRAQPVTYVRQQPSYVRTQPIGVVRAPVVPVSRASLQRDRYPPSPVQGYRRHYVESPRPVVAANPRVSFYSPAAGSFDDDHSNFDQPEPLRS